MKQLILNFISKLIDSSNTIVITDAIFKSIFVISRHIFHFYESPCMGCMNLFNEIIRLCCFENMSLRNWIIAKLITSILVNRNMSCFHVLLN